MKTTTFVKATVLAAGLTLGANSLPAAPMSNDWIEQHFKGKLGRNTPVEEARQRAEQANTAYRAEAPVQIVTPNWMEQHLKGKMGVYSPTEEARLRDLRSSTAYRAEAPAALPGLTWIEVHRIVKQGR